MSRKNLGAQGEELVANILLERGHQVLLRNWRTRWMEIDLVTQNNQEVWVVEVKTRTSERFGRPEAAVHPAKVRKIWLAAQVLAGRLPHDLTIRCMVAAVLLGPKTRIQLIQIPSI